MPVTPENENNGGQNALGDAFRNAGIGSQQTQGDQPRESQYGRRTESTQSQGPLGINGKFHRTVSRIATNQKVSEVTKGIEKVLNEYREDSAESTVKWIVTSIDNTQPNVKMAAVLMLAHFAVGVPNGGTKQVMLAYPLLLPGSVSSLGTRDLSQQQSFGQPSSERRSIIKQLTAADYVTPVFEEAVVNKLRKTYGDYEIVLIRGMTIPQTVDVNAPEQAETAHQIVVSAIGAIETFIDANYKPDYEPLTIADVCTGATVSVDMDLDPTPGKTATGLPLRRDITLTLKASVRSQQPGEPDEVMELVRVEAYMNLLYTDPDRRAVRDINPEKDTRRFTPWVIVNNMTPARINVVTPETQLLALLLPTMLVPNEQYVAPFTSRASLNDPNHDAGALTLVCPLFPDRGPEKIDMAELTVAEQLEVLRGSIFPEVHIGLVADRSGPMSWIYEMLVEEAAGSQDAHNAVLHYLDNLTMGRYSPIWQRRCQAEGRELNLFGLMPGGQHIGTYKDKSGQDRDLADLDSLWALNTYGNDPAAWDFMDTFQDVARDEVLMADRWRMITTRFPSANLVSEALVLEAMPALVETLGEAAADAGLTLRASRLLQDFSGTRGHASYAGGRGVDPHAAGVLFGRGLGGGVQNNRGGGFGGGFGSFYRRTR